MQDKVQVYLSYGDLNYCAHKKLGTLTIDEVLDLQKRLAQISPTQIQCPNFISARFEYYNDIFRGDKMPQPTYIKYTLHATFKYADDRAKCCQKYLLRNAPQMTKMCAHNLRTGKCQDEFMRQTIGAIMFPKLYGKDKQK